MSNSLGDSCEERVQHAPPIDLAELRREMHEAQIEGLVDELLATFVEDAPGQLEILDAAIQAADGNAVCMAAHCYRSAACTMRARRLATLLLELETAAHEGELSTVPPDLMPRVRCEHEATLAQCRQALGPVHKLSAFS